VKVKMIFFDMGGTIDLYPKDDSCVRNACSKMKQMLEEAGADTLRKLTEEEFQQRVLNGIKNYTNFKTTEYIELPPEKLCSDFLFNGLNINQNILNKLGEDIAFIIDMEFYNRQPRPEAREVLEYLKHKNLRMGIISNVLSKKQVPFCLNIYGLNQYFEVLSLSSILGKRKPHPDIFYYAFEKASVNPSEVIYVGNSPSKDIAGAKNVHVKKTVLIEYFENEDNDVGPEPDYKIKTLSELIPIIEEEKI